MIEDPLFYALAIPAFLILGIAKGGFGVALAAVSLPMLAVSVSVPQAAAIMLPLLMAMDLIGLPMYRGRWDATNMRIILPGAVVGTLLGYLAFSRLDEGWIRLLIGAIAVGYPLQARLRRRLAASPAAVPSWPKGSFWSVVSGFTSFVANAGGPAISVYLLPQRLDKTVFAATLVYYFAIINWLKVVPFWALGQFTTENLATALVLLPLAPIGMMLGRWLHDRVSETLFYRIVDAMLVVVGLRFLWDGVHMLAR